MAEYVEITIEQGATFTTTVTVSDGSGNVVDLNDMTVKAQIRKSYYSLTAYDFDVTIADPTNGEVVIEMSASNTVNLTPGRYVYDVIMIDMNEVVTRLFEGTVAVTPGVTRNE